MTIRISILAAGLVMFLVGCIQNDNETKKVPTVMDSLSKKFFDSQPDVSGNYTRYEGTIGDNSVVLNFVKTDGSTADEYYFTNYYYYTGKGILISLIGDSTANDSLRLTEYSAPSDFANQQLPRWKAKIQGDSISGVWTSANGKNSLPIQLYKSFPQGSMELDVYKFEDSLSAIKNHREVMARTKDIVLQPKKGQAKADWLKAEMKKIFDSSGKGTINQIIKKRNQAFFDDYKNDVKNLDSIDEGSIVSMNYDNSSKMAVRYNGRGFLVVEFLDYAFTGGAHGMQTTTLYCFDTENQKLMKWSDMLTADSTTLAPLVEKAFRTQYKLKPKASLTEYLFENYLGPNQNISFSPGGIYFTYQPYEIAAYAFGTIEVFLPFSDIKTYLNPAFAARLGF